MGFLVTIEAPDASGKATQAKLLLEHLKKDGYNTASFSFPNYGSDACKPAELYLSGALGKNASDTGAYAASTFFAVDRYFSYRTQWKTLYEQENTVIVLDRYTTSNAVHQIGKLPQNQWDEFLEWLYDFEFVKLGLPIPDITLSLDVPPETSHKLMKLRASTDTGHVTDIHEADLEYLDNCYKAGKFARDKWGWTRIDCCDGENNMLSREHIHTLIYDAVKSKLSERL